MRQISRSAAAPVCLCHWRQTGNPARIRQSPIWIALKSNCFPLQTKEAFARLVAVGLVLLLATPPQALAQASSANPTLKPEELDQL